MGRGAGGEDLTIGSTLTRQEWTQILSRAMDVFRSEAADHITVASGGVGNQNPFPDLVHVFDKQFRQWRDKSEAAARECQSEERTIGYMIGNVRLYDQYARLIVHSFGLQRAMEILPIDLPAAFAEVSGPWRTALTISIKALRSD